MQTSLSRPSSSVSGEAFVFFSFFFFSFFFFSFFFFFFFFRYLLNVGEGLGR